MAPISLADVVSSLPSDESWGPATPTENTLDGVPYAPYSKADKLGRMADWTAEGKDGRDRRGGQGFRGGFRGSYLHFIPFQCLCHYLAIRYTRMFCDCICWLQKMVKYLDLWREGQR